MVWVVLWYWFSFWCNRGLAPFQIWTYAFPTWSYDFLLEDVLVTYHATHYWWREHCARQQAAHSSSQIIKSKVLQGKKTKTTASVIPDGVRQQQQQWHQPQLTATATGWCAMLGNKQKQGSNDSSPVKEQNFSIERPIDYEFALNKWLNKQLYRLLAVRKSTGTEQAKNRLPRIKRTSESRAKSFSSTVCSHFSQCSSFTSIDLGC